MGKEICVAVFALAYFGLSAGESYALPSALDEPPPFRFTYSEAEMNDPVSRRALDTRLRREARLFCQQNMSRSPVLQLGCRSAMTGAARAQMRMRVTR